MELSRAAFHSRRSGRQVQVCPTLFPLVAIRTGLASLDPNRVPIVGGAVADVRLLATVFVDHVDLSPPVAVGAKRDLGAIRRPGWMLVQGILVESNLPVVPAIRSHEEDRILTLGPERYKRDEILGGRPNRVVVVGGV